ncbi:glutamyl-tRNA amidotransferase subunit A [Streptomyces albospinus]|uniref:Glutamyl-tRNA amidotransferase subunit A n=1 Tax=Streptomyces albospinus TaxID=285515 RepID=A0ABQ2VBJ6_9ACTN|nr:glutamyl-tRNA amidotransferase subunit A [Streptomyces albospinus]
MLGYRSLVQEAAALRSGAADPVDAVHRVCDRIDAVDRHVRAFVPEDGRRARLLEAARELAADGPPDPAVRPALYGVPVGIKDIVHVDGLPTRAGSTLPPEALGGAQAAVVDRLRAAGALIAGKTVTAEFAVTASGPTRNPHNPAHTPGGSSSGSAAAVAAGMVPLAIGTQTVGSMIRPAAYCGVVGFKPSYGRIPVGGVIPNAVSFDTLGCYAADVAGVALAAAVVCDGWEPYADGLRDGGERAAADGPRRRPVLGVPVGPYLERAGAEARCAFEEQRATLAAAGYEVREVPVMDDFERIVEQLFTMNRYEVARAHTQWFARYADRYREQTAAAIRRGHTIGDADYEAARVRRAAFRERLAADGATAGIDLWIAPSATGPAPADLTTTGSSIMCLPWSNAGLPSIGLPAGRAADGLPLGLQLVGAFGADEELLHGAAGIERALNGAAPAHADPADRP